MRQSSRSVALLLSQRGAVLPLVAFLIIAMLALAAFAVDIGYVMVTKKQLQNAADACALAAAPALRFEEPTKSTEVLNAVLAMAARHRAGNDESVYIVPAEDIAIDGDGYRLTVFCRKLQVRDNGLPLFFARILLKPYADVWAKATVLLTPTRTGCCVKPWSIPDLWDDATAIDGHGDWRNNNLWNGEEFEDSNGNRLYDAGEPFTDENGNGVYDSEAYDRALSQANEAGYIPSLPPDGHLGMEVVIKVGSTTKPGDRYAPSFFNPIVLPWPPEYDEGKQGAEVYYENIVKCNPTVIDPNEELQIESEPGNMKGKTISGTKEIISLDPTAFWNDELGEVDHMGGGGEVGVSPRIVLVPVFDPRMWPTAGRQTEQRGNAIVVSKIVALFIEGLDSDGTIRARVTKAPVSCMKGSQPGGGESFTYTFKMVE